MMRDRVMTEGASVDRRRPRRGTVVGGFLGGSLAWALLMASERTLRFADDAIAAAGENPSVETSIRLSRLVTLQGLGNAVIALGVMGQAFAGAAYLASHRGRGTCPKLVIGTVRACAVGFALGSLSAVVGTVAFGMQHVGDQDLFVASLIQGVVWALLGAAAGLAASRGLLEPPARRSPAASGALGGLLWGVLYPMVAAQLSPGSYVEQLIPESASHKAAWSILGGVLIGLALFRAERAAGKCPDGALADWPSRGDP